MFVDGDGVVGRVGILLHHPIDLEMMVVFIVIFTTADGYLVRQTADRRSYAIIGEGNLDCLTNNSIFIDLIFTSSPPW